MEDIPHFVKRKPTRLPEYDYGSINYYFVTICTHEKKCIFGSPMHLNRNGKIALDEFIGISSHYKGVRLDHFVVMPNHVHAIVVIEGTQDQTNLSNIIGSYKSGVSKRIHEAAPNIEVWQRSFHDHVIRGQKDYEKIWEYINTNPARWEDDCFYSVR